MSSYVMSDIHGHLKEFNEMLRKIQFDIDNDTLYLLGDYVDWGNESIELLLKLVDLTSKHENIICLMGNHDKMMYDIIKVIDNSISEEEALNVLSKSETCLKWYNWCHNGGYKTLSDYLKLDSINRDKIKRWISQLRYFIPDLEVNGNKFYLCHSKPLLKGMSMEDVIWERMKADRISKQYLDKYPDTTVVSGHTIVYHFNSIDKSELKCKIFKPKCIPYINIDCGAKVIEEGKYGRLGCLRLEDLAEFYV